MSKEWYLMGPPQVKDSGFERDEFMDYALDYFEEALNETILGEPVVLYQNGNLDESTAIHTNTNVWGNTPIREHFFDIRHIVARIGQLKLGNYVKYQDRIYIITEIPGNNQIYEHGWMRVCNYDLRWVSDSGKIVEFPCAFGDATRFSFGEKENKYLVIGDVRLEVWIAKNTETVKIKRGKRFIIDDYDNAQVSDPMVYEVTKPNLSQKASKEGSVFIWVVTENSFNPALDCRERMIANFHNRINTYSLSLVTPKFIEIEQGKTFNIQVEAKVNDTDAKDEIEYLCDDNIIANVNTDGEITGLELGTTTIKVSFHQAEPLYIDVKIVERKGQFQDTARIIGEPVLRLGGVARTYSASFFDAFGQPVKDIAVWSVSTDGNEGMPSFLNIVEQTASSIRIQAVGGTQNTGKKIYLRLTSASGMSTDTMEIEIVSLT
jgi:hypothetical protein